jgi:citrate synthase
VLKLPPGSPLVLFAIARSVGWIGHAIEQYENGHLIRPRAKYVGVAPAPDGVATSMASPT